MFVGRLKAGKWALLLLFTQHGSASHPDAVAHRQRPISRLLAEMPAFHICLCSMRYSGRAPAP
ncbi:hypothetical protein BSU04_39995 [Caballeronia sordidicola]|uniref:Uncharacterized protein n=1 Tax=Caballeronia sordidicola TaxID=196367 RepID=A0A226WNZ9_CABSO|nr:hypothetical protein BSU04_39995 [Caballeronia sordidicola]